MSKGKIHHHSPNSLAVMADRKIKEQETKGPSGRAASAAAATARLEKLPFTRELISSFRPSKTFRYCSAGMSITSIDFDDSGHYALTAAEDETIHIYDCRTGKHQKELYSKKYGVHLARFTHHNMNCIYASTKEDDTIRYLSLHDNSFIRYFKGHKRRVIDLEISPVGDEFLSSSLDQTVRLWDLRSPTCQGLLTILAPSLVAFDPSGLVFAIACEAANQVAIYDLRNFDSEPFATFHLSNHYHRRSNLSLTKLEFSNDGKLLLVATKSDVHFVLDAFTGETLATLVGSTPLPKPRLFTSGSAGFTPDGRFVLAGCGDKRVAIWDLHSPQLPDMNRRPMASLECDQGLPNIVTFNPRHMMFATADQELVMWLPELPTATTTSSK